MEENELIPVDNNNAVEYTDDNIRHLSDMDMCAHAPVCISVGWATVHMPKTESMSS